MINLIEGPSPAEISKVQQSINEYDNDDNGSSNVIHMSTNTGYSVQIL